MSEKWYMEKQETALQAQATWLPLSWVREIVLNFMILMIRQLLKDFQDELEGVSAGNKPLFEDVWTNVDKYLEESW